MGVLIGSRHMTIPAGAVTVRGARGAAAAAWYRAGGAPLSIAAYQPKGAASYAASKINIANPGTYDATDGSSPLFWTTEAGWAGDGGIGGLTRYVDTHITPAGTWAMLVCYAGTGNTDHALCGIRSGGAFELWHVSGGNSYYANGTLKSTNLLNSGTLGFAEKAAYRDGVADGSIGAGAFSSTDTIFIGGINSGGAMQFSFKGTISAWVIWDDTTNHAVWMPAVSAAMAAL